MSDYEFDKTLAAKKFLDGENPNETEEDAFKAFHGIIIEYYEKSFPNNDTDLDAEEILKNKMGVTDWSDASCFASEKVLKSIVVGDYETAAKRYKSILDHKAVEKSQRQRANRIGTTNKNKFFDEFIKANIQASGGNLTPQELKDIISVGNDSEGENPIFPENDKRTITIEDETTIVVNPTDGQAEKKYNGTDSALRSRICRVKMRCSDFETEKNSL